MSQRGSGVGCTEPEPEPGRPPGGTVAGRGAAATAGLRAPKPASVAPEAEPRRASQSGAEPEPPFVWVGGPRRGGTRHSRGGTGPDGTEGPGAAAGATEPIWERGECALGNEPVSEDPVGNGACPRMCGAVGGEITWAAGKGWRGQSTRTSKMGADLSLPACGGAISPQLKVEVLASCQGVGEVDLPPSAVVPGNSGPSLCGSVSDKQGKRFTAVLPNRMSVENTCRGIFSRHPCSGYYSF